MKQGIHAMIEPERVLVVFAIGEVGRDCNG